MVTLLKNLFESPAHANYKNITVFIGHPGFEKHFTPLKSLQINSVFGMLELAIIGSSHYLKVPGYLSEVVSTTQQTFNEQETISTQKGNFSEISMPVNNLHYRLTKHVDNNFASKADYKKAVTSHIATSQLHYKFGLLNTGVTTLRYTQTDHRFVLHTMHSYPQQRAIVYTTTSLSLLTL